jgi:hypothetical protein
LSTREGARSRFVLGFDNDQAQGGLKGSGHLIVAEKLIKTKGRGGRRGE